MTLHLNSNAQAEEWVGVGALKAITDKLFPGDTDLPFWIWKILLRDVLFFLLMYPSWKIRGRQFQLEIHHVYTRQTREEWIADIDRGVYDIKDLLNPHLWLIELGSLRREYHKLFVYHEHWRCPDAVNHSKWLNLDSYQDAQRNIDRLVSRDERAAWEHEGYIQRINPCVYSVLRWWLVVFDRPTH